MTPQAEVTFGVFLKNFLYIPAAIAGLSTQNYVILAVLLVFDILTGVWRSAVIEGRDSIKSWKAWNGFFSKFLFLSVPVVVAYMGHGAGLDLTPLARMSLGLLTLSTGYSILGNVYSIRSGEAVKEFDALRVVLKAIEGVLNRYTVPSDHKD